MAIQAVLAYRRVFKEKWPALLRVAAVANLIDAIGLEKRGGRGTVRIVAIDAGDFALKQRHVRTLVEFGPLHLVASKTGLIDGLASREPMGGKIRHGIVAIAAGEIVVLVNRAVPKDSRAALVTGETLGVLPCDGCDALV